MPESFTKEEKTLLSPFFSNLDKDVFVLKNMPEVVKGTLFSRYSRSSKPLRRLLLDDFMNSDAFAFKQIVGKGLGKEADLVAVKKAEEFYDRVLVDYGDDSVAELGGTHIGIENVSNLAAKALEDSRIGLSPLEKSTRYIYFDKKVDGSYLFLTPPEIASSKHAAAFEETCNLLFDTYASLVKPVSKYFEKKFPQEKGVSDRAYAASIRAKTCDTIRVLLPAATKTNLGIFGNGRAFEYLLVKLAASPLQEMHDLAEVMRVELATVIPSFVKRSGEELGKQQSAFLSNQREADATASSTLDLPEPEEITSPKVALIDYDKEAEEKIITALWFPHTDASMEELRTRAAALAPQEREALFAKHLAGRENRRHKPARAFENAYYTFDAAVDFGSYRDLHRHRVLTQERQLLSTRHGYDMPPELEDAGVADKVHAALKHAADTFEKIAKDLPFAAQYVVPFGYTVRFYFTLNVRELYHLVELRSTRYGHPGYRKIVQDMYSLVKEVHPSLVEAMAFVDMKSYGLERLASEQATDEKIRKVKEKYGAEKN